MKPEVTLTQLEEEPEIGLFSLTFTELKAILTQSFVVAVIAAIGISFFMRWTNAAIAGMVVAGLFGWLRVKATSSNRADKPLYYHRHLKTHKNTKLFIQPAKYYQIERSSHGLSKK